MKTIGRIRNLRCQVLSVVSPAAMPPLVAQLAGNAFWSTLGVTISRGLQFVSYIVVARVLGSAGFGRFGLIQSTLAMFGIVGTFGLGLTATRYISKYRHLDPEKAGRIISLSRTIAVATGTTSAIALYFSADWLAVRSMGDPLLGPLLKVASVALALTAISAAQMGALSGFQAFKSIARLNLIAGLVSFPATLALVHFFGITGGVWALNFGMGTMCCLGALTLKRTCHDDGICARTFSWKEDSPILLGFSLPAALCAAMIAPSTWLANATLVRLPGGLVQIGLFSASNTVRTLLLYLPAILMQSSFPVLAAAYSNGGERQEFRRALVMTHNWINVPAAVLGIFTMFGASTILALFGPEYRQGSTVFVVLMAATVIQAMGSAVGATVQVRGDMWFALCANAAWAATYLIVARSFAGTLGAVSLSLGHYLAYAVLLGWQMAKLRSDLPPGMEQRVYASLALTSASAALAASWHPVGLSAGRILMALLLAAALGGIMRIRPEQLEVAAL